jgi:UPF0042 nucleotide-binding protein
MEFLIISGMSGSGKSRAINALEDIGFYCVDNMPPKLLPVFVELSQQAGQERVAVVIDSRAGCASLELLPEMIDSLREEHRLRVLFLECEDLVLARRYKETRRVHPMQGQYGTVSAAISAEREPLSPIRQRADYLVDTTLLSPIVLRERISEMFLSEEDALITLECMSFGFKYGYPAEADMVFDVRCFPNPYYIKELKAQTGLDAAVSDYVMACEDVQVFRRKLHDMVQFLLPLYIREGKRRLVVAIGCTGGRHRSVTLAEDLARFGKELGYPVTVNHRDIQK